jgi:hypothetical protein
VRRARGLPPAHRGATVELRTLYPFVVPDDLGVDGCYIGREASGGLFCFDPWECYARGRLTSPNMVVIGQIGRGKSAFVKSLLCFTSSEYFLRWSGGCRWELPSGIPEPLRELDRLAQKYAGELRFSPLPRCDRHLHR